MEISEIIAGNCDKSSINSALSAQESHECLSPLGTYRATDIIVAGIGFFSSVAAPLMALKQTGRLKISRGWSKNLARLRLLLGIGMVSTAFADATGLLTAEGQPLDWEQVVGLAVPPFVIEITLFLLGVMVIKKAANNLRRKPRSEFSEPWQSAGAGDFRGSLEKNKGSSKRGGVMTVGDLRSALSLDQYEDIFQLGTSSGDDMSVGRTCHYCNGQGCAQCDFKGEFM
jgi:hypothetical protein